MCFNCCKISLPLKCEEFKCKEHRVTLVIRSTLLHCECYFFNSFHPLHIYNKNKFYPHTKNSYFGDGKDFESGSWVNIFSSNSCRSISCRHIQGMRARDSYILLTYYELFKNNSYSMGLKLNRRKKNLLT